MKKKKDNVKLIFELILLSIGLIFIIAYLSKFFFYVDGYFQFNEWIASIIGLIGALIGGIFTMVGVIYTLNSSISDKESEKNEKIKRLKFILKYEIEYFIDSLKNEILNYTEKKLKILEGNLNVFNGSREKNIFKIENVYKMDSRFKEYMYELILLDNSDDFKDELIEFFRSYSLISQQSYNIDEVGDEIKKFYSSECNYLIEMSKEMNKIGDDIRSINKFILEEKERIEYSINNLRKRDKEESRSFKFMYILDYLCKE
ncbi:hypothetical protein [Clostridium perfringens]|uniref:hypothetical protein n=1 Tax=Clostridium perfringens TaxID=1502 RepID=UPI001C8530F8|nr:hypothetical protein [Clostridium perfringens]MDK0582261.1 hypothetical protein [Clostridium perfringens]